MERFYRSMCQRAFAPAISKLFLSLLPHVLVGVLLLSYTVDHLVRRAHGDAGDGLHVSRHGRAEQHRLPLGLLRQAPNRPNIIK